MKRKFVTVFCLTCILQLASSLSADVEEDISLDEVPPGVIDSINKVYAGFRPQSAEEISRKTTIMYELEGEYEGRKVEILVSPTGEIVCFDGTSCDVYE